MKVSFDKDIYSEKAVIKAIRDYSGIAEIRSMQSRNEIVCVIQSGVYPTGLTGKEFANHVLNLTVVMRSKT